MLALVACGGKPAICRLARSASLSASFLSAALILLIFICTALAGSAALADAPGPDQTLNVALDEARVVKAPDRVVTIVVGNPLIADVSLQSGGLMVITGKGYGNTNLIALDRSGNALLEKSLRVRGPRDHVMTVYRGIERETYSCAPKCERRITPGDNQQYFNQTLTQTAVRNSQAAGMAK